MSKIKLYTEEQVMEAYHIGEDDGNWGRYREDVVALKLTPIELPSEEEIENYANETLVMHSHSGIFVKGAKWVIEQIKQQDNGK